MKATITTAITTLVRSEEPEVDLRLDAQAEALKENPCLDPRVGQWIDLGVEYLESVFDLDNLSFAKQFPGFGHVDRERRQQMKAEIESHLGHCRHCSLKQGYDLELDARIMRACRENRDDILQLLEQEDVDLSEGEHLANETETGQYEHHTNLQRESDIVMDPVAEPV